LSPLPSSIKGLLFDLDGVIVHSTPLHTKAWEVYLAQFGIEPERVRNRMFGLHNDDVVRDFFGDGLSQEEITRHGMAKEAVYRELMRPRLAEFLVPGVGAFLRRVAEQAPCAVGSNAEQANVSFVLEESGLRPYFRVVLDGNQVARPKPAPDIYIKAAELLGVEIRDCVIFEDSLVGARAAVASGARVIGIATTATSLPGVERMVRDFADPALFDWLAELEPVG
jgi:beta-phosphoglucomutase